MNGWDLFTWIAAALLAASAVTIFAFFAKDARKLFREDLTDRSDDDE